jgi:hypothetical protein
VKVAKADGKTTLTLEAKEVELLRAALERASFIDTPPEKQEAILEFAAKALEQIARA